MAWRRKGEAFNDLTEIASELAKHIVGLTAEISKKAEIGAAVGSLALGNYGLMEVAFDILGLGEKGYLDVLYLFRGREDSYNRIIAKEEVAHRLESVCVAVVCKVRELHTLDGVCAFVCERGNAELVWDVIKAVLGYKIQYDENGEHGPVSSNEGTDLSDTSSDEDVDRGSSSSDEDASYRPSSGEHRKRLTELERAKRLRELEQVRREFPKDMLRRLEQKIREETRVCCEGISERRLPKLATCESKILSCLDEMLAFTKEVWGKLGNVRFESEEERDARGGCRIDQKDGCIVVGKKCIDAAKARIERLAAQKPHEALHHDF